MSLSTHETEPHSPWNLLKPCETVLHSPADTMWNGAAQPVAEVEDSAEATGLGAAELFAEAPSFQSLAYVTDIILRTDAEEVEAWRKRNSHHPRRTSTSIVGHISSSVRWFFSSSAAQPAMQVECGSVPLKVLCGWLQAKAEERRVHDCDVKKLLCEFVREEHTLWRFKQILARAAESSAVNMTAEGVADREVLNSLLPLVEASCTRARQALVECVTGCASQTRSSVLAGPSTEVYDSSAVQPVSRRRLH